MHRFSLLLAHETACSLSLGLLGLLLLLHLSGDGRVVELLEQSPSFVGLLLKVVDVGDKLDGVDDALVVQKHTSDLAGGCTVLGLDNKENSVANFLTALSCLHGVESVDINVRETSLLLGHHSLLLRGELLLSLGLSSELLLLLLSHHSLLLRSRLLALVGRGLTLVLLVVLAVRTTVASLSNIATARTVSVVLAALATTLVGSSTLLIVATLTELATLSSEPLVLATHALHGATIAQNSLCEVLLNLLEATLLTLLVQLLSGHPELDGERTGTEGSRLIETLDGALGTVDVLVEDKVLTVGSVRVEELALSQFDRNDGSELLEKISDFFLFDFRGDVLDEEVGLVGLAHAALDCVACLSLGSNLVFSLGDVTRDKEVATVGHLLLVHGLDGSLCSFRGLERNVALGGVRLTCVNIG